MDETHFDAIVVGSRFGGSVMAYRLAEGGSRVCLLERGKACYNPLPFPAATVGDPYYLYGSAAKKVRFFDDRELIRTLFTRLPSRGVPGSPYPT
jgi:choline dehydrogenase-like flavoprotein